MKKTIACSLITLTLSLLLPSCCNYIPPARINWQTQPGNVQRINMNPRSPYYKQYQAHPASQPFL
jgi:hypothetical protein